MKKILSLFLVFLLTMLPLSGTAQAAEGPDDYQSITGFEITDKLVKGGHMGSEEEPFPVNGLIAKDTCMAKAAAGRTKKVNNQGGHNRHTMRPPCSCLFLFSCSPRFGGWFSLYPVSKVGVLKFLEGNQ